jgi:ketosteroid isomerase-like protein
MSATPLEVVARVYAARAVKDIAAMMAQCDAAIIFTFNADADKIGSGTLVIGVPACLRQFERIAAIWEELDYSHGTLRADGAKVRVLVNSHMRHRASGEVLRVTKTQIWTVRDGRITAMDEILDRTAVHAFQRFADLMAKDYDAATNPQSRIE